MSIGFPGILKVLDFTQKIYDVFGEYPYHVGSSLTNKNDWRDVDIRLILDDEVYAAWGFGNPHYPQHNAKWAAMCRALTSLGREMTELPIDFQIQQRTDANEHEPGMRSWLGCQPGSVKHTSDEPVATEPPVVPEAQLSFALDFMRHMEQSRVPGYLTLCNVDCAGFGYATDRCTYQKGHKNSCHKALTGTFYCNLCGKELGQYESLAELHRVTCTGAVPASPVQTG